MLWMNEWMKEWIYWYAKVYQGNTTESIILVKGSLYTLYINKLSGSAINEHDKHKSRKLNGAQINYLLG